MAPERELGFDEWESMVSPERGGDPLWRMTAYRLASYLADRAWTVAMHSP
jgi:hypothetical protein